MRSSDLLDAELEALTKAKQAMNEAISRANRKKHRVDQRVGARIVRIPPAIRKRALMVFDAIVEDEKLLEQCEGVISEKSIGDSPSWLEAPGGTDQEAAE